MIGVLALQGAFSKHAETLDKVGAKSILVRTPEELLACQGLILPGGESTVMWHLMEEGGLLDPLIHFRGALFGTCAGLIILTRLGLLKIDVERNAYGRQSASFSTKLPSCLGDLEAIFIRAPRIRKILDKKIEILAHYEDAPVLIQKDRYLAATFHPELTEDLKIHHYFKEIVEKSPIPC